jgi:hypothetical protein
MAQGLKPGAFKLWVNWIHVIQGPRQVAAAHARVGVGEERLVVRRGGERGDLLQEKRRRQVQPGLPRERLRVASANIVPGTRGLSSSSGSRAHDFILSTCVRVYK